MTVVESDNADRSTSFRSEWLYCRCVTARSPATRFARASDRSRYVRDVPTALLSVYDKSGIVEFAKGLHDLGWTIVSSGGTAAAIAAAGVPVTDVVELTGVPAILGHRVVTLHPKIHGGILADPTLPDHQADMAEYDIEPIDLVVVNLYPFTQRSRHPADRHRRPGDGPGGGEEPRASSASSSIRPTTSRCWPRSPPTGR